MRALICFTVLLIFLPLPGYGDTYKWVDERGRPHFADDLSNVPEQYRSGAETRKGPRETQKDDKLRPPPPPQSSLSAPPQAYEVDLVRRHELLMAEVMLERKVKQHFVVDTGASFTLISRQTARDLAVTINDSTPYIPVATVSDVILTPLVTLKSVRVGNAEEADVDALIYNMPSGSTGLLGNSFLNRFRVVIDSLNGKMTLFPVKGIPSPDRPGGYGRDFWQGQFHFHQHMLAELAKIKSRYERQGGASDLSRVKNAIQHFENSLSELERRASFAGVPRNWRE